MHLQTMTMGEQFKLAVDHLAIAGARAVAIEAAARSAFDLLTVGKAAQGLDVNPYSLPAVQALAEALGVNMAEGIRPVDPRTAPHGVPQAVASAAGYSVEESGGLWFVNGPDGETVAEALKDASAAWAAALAHHEARTPRPGEFARCIKAGYAVEEDCALPGWIAREPEGSEINPAKSWPTERAAWEACERHRTGAEG